MRAVAPTSARRLPGTFAWYLTSRRTARYKTQELALADMRRLQGLHITPSEYAQWESGSRVPRDDNPKRLALYEFYGGHESDDVVQSSTALGDLSAVVGVLTRQAEAIERQADNVKGQSDSFDTLAVELKAFGDQVAAGMVQLAGLLSDLAQRVQHVEDQVRRPPASDAPDARRGSGGSRAGRSNRGARAREALTS